MKNNLLYKPTDFFAEARNEAEVDNLLNTDVYKILMLDFILAHEEYKDVPVRWEMTIRSQDVQTANVIPEESLRNQLEMTKNIAGVSEADLTYLRGMTNSDGTPLLQEATLQHLRDFQLPDYEIGVDENNNYTLSFTGPWSTSLMWEIYGLKIFNSLYNYHYIKKARLSNVEFTKIINESLYRLFTDIETIKQEPGLKFSEFGTRRSLSTDYQRLVLDILNEQLPGQCLGSSNVLLSREAGNANPKGTNAHELRMIPTALVDDPEEIVATMYNIDRQWAAHFPELSILLPDTYGTSYYLDNCPADITANHIGCRFDSKDPNDSIPEYATFLERNNIDPQQKLGIPSDGLTAQSAVDIYRNNKDQLGNLSFGIGTNLTNNTKGTWPRESEPYGPFGSFSVVIKPAAVQRTDGTRTSCVKLSDNPAKAVGDPARVELFKSIFGSKGVAEQSVLV